MVATPLGPLSYSVQMQSGALWRRHIEQLWEREEPEITSNPPNEEQEATRGELLAVSN